MKDQAREHVRMGQLNSLQGLFKPVQVHTVRQFEQRGKLIVSVIFRETLTGKVNAELRLR